MDCPICGLNCGDTCYRPSVDTRSKLVFKLSEIEARLREEEVRAALINLGWTPPEEDNI